MNDFIEVRQMINMFLRWWWLIILSTIVAAAASFAISQQQTPIYQASTTIMVGELHRAIEIERTDIQTGYSLAQVYADMAHRELVLQGVIDNLNLNTSWATLTGKIGVLRSEESAIFTIIVEDPSPAHAQLLVAEIANQLILVSPSERLSQEEAENSNFARQRLQSLEQKIQRGQTRLTELEAALSEPLSAQELKNIQSEMNTLEDLIIGWERNYTELLTLVGKNESPNSLTIIDPAQASSTPIRPRTYFNTVIAGAIGLALSLGLIFLLTSIDTGVRTEEDVIQLFGAKPLGIINRTRSKTPGDHLLLNLDSFSPITEAYRLLRSNIRFLSIDQPTRSLMVTTPDDEENRSIVVANLGIIMAQAGLKTVIIDADLRQPKQHTILQTPNLTGLTELLRSPNLAVPDQVQTTKASNLWLLPSGRLPRNPTELLDSQRMNEIIYMLGELADVIIFDSPPVLPIADAPVLSNKVDSVILVIEAGNTRHPKAQEAIGRIQQTGARLLGVVLTNATQEKKQPKYQSNYDSFTLNEVAPAPQVLPKQPDREKRAALVNGVAK